MRQYVDTTLQICNSFWPTIQFTSELEVNGSLPYLDVRVIRSENGTLSTNWYRKPTDAGKVINFLSAHPFHQKSNVAFNLFFRVLSISDEQYHQENNVPSTFFLPIIIHQISSENNYTEPNKS